MAWIVGEIGRRRWGSYGSSAIFSCWWGWWSWRVPGYKFLSFFFVQSRFLGLPDFDNVHRTSGKCKNIKDGRHQFVTTTVYFQPQPYAHLVRNFFQYVFWRKRRSLTALLSKRFYGISDFNPVTTRKALGGGNTQCNFNPITALKWSFGIQLCSSIYIYRP